MALTLVADPSSTGTRHDRPWLALRAGRVSMNTTDVPASATASAARIARAT